MVDQGFSSAWDLHGWDMLSLLESSAVNAQLKTGMTDLVTEIRYQSTQEDGELFGGGVTKYHIEARLGAWQVVSGWGTTNQIVTVSLPVVSLQGETANQTKRSSFYEVTDVQGRTHTYSLDGITVEVQVRLRWKAEGVAGVRKLVFDFRNAGGSTGSSDSQASDPYQGIRVLPTGAPPGATGADRLRIKNAFAKSLQANQEKVGFVFATLDPATGKGASWLRPQALAYSFATPIGSQAGYLAIWASTNPAASALPGNVGTADLPPSTAKADSSSPKGWVPVGEVNLPSHIGIVVGPGTGIALASTPTLSTLVPAGLSKLDATMTVALARDLMMRRVLLPALQKQFLDADMEYLDPEYLQRQNDQAEEKSGTFGKLIAKVRAEYLKKYAGTIASTNLGYAMVAGGHHVSASVHADIQQNHLVLTVQAYESEGGSFSIFDASKTMDLTITWWYKPALAEDGSIRWVIDLSITPNPSDVKNDHTGWLAHVGDFFHTMGDLHVGEISGSLSSDLLDQIGLRWVGATSFPASSVGLDDLFYITYGAG